MRCKALGAGSRGKNCKGLAPLTVSEHPTHGRQRGPRWVMGLEKQNNLEESSQAVDGKGVELQKPTDVDAFEAGIKNEIIEEYLHWLKLMGAF